MLVLVGLGGVAPWGCRSTEPDPETHRRAAPPRPVAAERDVGPWRYLPTLQAAAPQGIAIEPILELDESLHGRVHMLAVVARDKGPTLELWSFDQSNEANVLRPSGEPKVLFGLAPPAPDPATLEDFSRRMAAPGTELRRILGAEKGMEPTEALKSLVRSAQVATNTGATAEHRARALAALFQPLQNSVLLRTRPVTALVDLLAAETTTISAPHQLGARRVRTDLVSPDGSTLRVEWARTGHRWAIVGLDVSPPSASPPP